MGLQIRILVELRELRFSFSEYTVSLTEKIQLSRRKIIVPNVRCDIEFDIDF